MADPYDGDDFLALDAEMFEAYSPHDTWSANAIRNQAAWLLRHVGAHTGLAWVSRQNTASAYIGDKSWASTRWLCIYFADFVVWSGLRQLIFDFQARLGHEGVADNPDVSSRIELKIQLEGYGIETFLWEELTPATSQYEQRRVTFELESSPIRQHRTILRIWMRSRGPRVPHGLGTPPAIKQGRPGQHPGHAGAELGVAVAAALAARGAQ